MSSEKNTLDSRVAEDVESTSASASASAPRRRGGRRSRRSVKRSDHPVTGEGDVTEVSTSAAELSAATSGVDASAPRSAPASTDTTEESDAARGEGSARRGRSKKKRSSRRKRSSRGTARADGDATPTKASDAAPKADEAESRHEPAGKPDDFAAGVFTPSTSDTVPAKGVVEAGDAGATPTDAASGGEPSGEDASGTRKRSKRGRGRRRKKAAKAKGPSAEGAATEPQPDVGTVPEPEPELESDVGAETKKARPPRTKKKRGARKAAPPQDAEAESPQQPRRLLIDCMDPEEIRIAVLENDTLEELYFDRTEDKKYLGNIYKGRVVNLEPAIQAAFVEIGIGRNGFLHVSDVLPIYTGADRIPIDELSKRPRERKRLRIQDMLQKGQELLVQISKDSIGAKGPSLTTYVSIPGKNLVLMSGVSRFGVSKKIQDREIRAKLRETLSTLDPPEGLGFIIRTAGKDISREALDKDLTSLKDTWTEIREKVLTRQTPCLLRRESDLITRAMRDVCGPEVREVLVNDEAAYHKVAEVVREIMPQSEKIVRQYTGTVPLFSKFKVEEDIEKIYNRRIPLPSGGYLIVEQTEALVSIDVNSGKYTAEENLEETALKINLEAADEIARQLRLRDLGGVIVNDFIDMVQDENRRKVEKAFRTALKRDRAKCWVSKISRFGIVEMTRQRVRPSLERTIYEPCKYCSGTGMIKSVRAVGTAILRQLRVALATRKRDTAEVIAHPEVQSYLLNERRRYLLEMEEAYHKTIRVLAEASRHPEEFTIRFP